MKIATFIKSFPRHNGEQRLYEVSEKVAYAWGESTNFIMVSKIIYPGEGPETYAFASDEAGDILDFCELDFSQKGEVSHEKVLMDAGYKVIT